jgi:hypothetical protein
MTSNFLERGEKKKAKSYTRVAPDKIIKTNTVFLDIIHYHFHVNSNVLKSALFPSSRGAY